MTVIAVRDGVMAVDSLVAGNGCIYGEARKWREVPGVFGGGFIAGAGDLSRIQEALDDFAANGRAALEEGALLWLRPDGSVRLMENGKWCEYSADFYAEGSGAEMAVGAMAAGATAEEAVRIACQYSTTCGGEVHVLTALSQ